MEFSERWRWRPRVAGVGFQHRHAVGMGVEHSVAKNYCLIPARQLWRDAALKIKADKVMSTKLYVLR